MPSLGYEQVAVGVADSAAGTQRDHSASGQIKNIKRRGKKKSENKVVSSNKAQRKINECVLSEDQT